MNKIYKLINKIKHYEWGSKEIIPGFLNIQNDKDLRYAEMWMGTHPAAPSQTEENGKIVNLSEISGELPFLFKLLAVEKPLSVQVHPDREQASYGYNKENEEGISLDACNRNYKDKNCKNEIICAITPFTLMAGFKNHDDVFLSYKGTYKEQTDLKNRLADLYPEDPVVSSALYLNLVTLEPGQAVFLPAGVPHSYVSGFGLELMNSSDNVIRGGLTSKHVDIKKLEKIIDYEPFKLETITPDVSKNVFKYPIQCNDFSLLFVQSRGDKTNVELNAPAICIVTDGELIIEDDKYRKGGSFYISQAKEKFTLSGNFKLFAASANSFSSNPSAEENTQYLGKNFGYSS